MLKNLFFTIVVFVATILIYAATKPDTFHVERSATIQSPAEKIFPLLNDLHRWQEWSAWEKYDPNMKKVFSGAEQGKGARYAWEGNKKVGIGSMEIIESIPSEKIAIKLKFAKPFAAENIATLTLSNSQGNTQIIWSMDGDSPYISKVFGFFLNMDDMIGKDFERSLASLKAIVEAK